MQKMFQICLFKIILCEIVFIQKFHEIRYIYAGATNDEGHWISEVPRVLSTDTKGAQDSVWRGHQSRLTTAEVSKEEGKGKVFSLVNVFKTNSFYSFLFLFFDIISSCSVSTQYAKLSNKKLTAHRERSTFRKPLAMRVILVFIIYVALCLFFQFEGGY